MRLLDNCSLDADKVRGIMDDLDYYVDSNQVGLHSVVSDQMYCVMLGEPQLCQGFHKFCARIVSKLHQLC